MIPRSKNLDLAGRVFFGLALIGSGLLQLTLWNFVRLVPKLPAWVARPEWWAAGTGPVLVGIGLAIALDRNRRVAAAIAAGLLFTVFLLYLPGLIENPRAGFMWTNPAKTLALLGAVLLLAATPRGWNPASAWIDAINVGKTPSFTGGRIPPLSAALFGVFLVICGVQHFVYADFVVTLVPAWLPGLRFWVYFTAVALIAGGIGVNYQATARFAATLSGLMIFLWVLLLHIPRAVHYWPETNETAAIFEALALSGTALLLVGIKSGPKVKTVSPEPKL